MTVYSSDELKKLRVEEAGAERAPSGFTRYTGYDVFHVSEEEHASLYAAEAMASRVSPAQEIPVTEEMVAAADNAWSGGAFRDAAAEIYRAMAAVAPVALVSDAELRVAALEAENAALLADNLAWQKAWEDERTFWRNFYQQAAAFTTPPAPEPRSFPAAALKPSKGDPRRVGG